MIWLALAFIALLFVAGFKNAAAGCAQILLFLIVALVVAFFCIVYIGATA